MGSVSGFSVLLTTIFVYVLFAILLLWRRKRNCVPLPPGPPGWPIIGNLFQLGRKPNESLFALSKRYGPLMTLSLGMKTTVIVSSPEMAKEFLRTHDHVFAGRVQTQASTTLSHHKSSIVVGEYGPRWQTLRRISSTQLITTKMLQSLHHLRRDEVSRMTRTILEMEGKRVNIPHMVFCTGVNVITNMIWSRSLVDPNSEGSREFQDTLAMIMKIGGTPNVADIFPFLAFIDPQGLRRRLAKHLHKIHKLLDVFINDRMEGLGPERRADDKDFLDVLLELRGDDMTLTDIRAIIYDLIVAGSETTSTALEWVMAELICNPHSMKRVQEELKEVVGYNRQVEESDIGKLPYLQAVMKEGFRLHPPLPLLIPHRAESRCEIDGYMIPKHSEVIVNVWAMGRDPAIWKDPSKFLPERFLESENSNKDFKGRDFDLIPFGSGRRICMGLPLANRMVYLILGSLLHSFEWNLPDGQSELDMRDTFGVTLKKEVDLHLLPTPRLPHHLYL
ncbi:hypothetical protein KI387_018245 [Taxus chinensis]|nr:hypothetical protein KI387_018245 [Taxus chinensis]